MPSTRKRAGGNQGASDTPPQKQALLIATANQRLLANAKADVKKYKEKVRQGLGPDSPKAADRKEKIREEEIAFADSVNYAATKVKNSLVGTGRASKLQIQKAVASRLQLSRIPEPNDVADALALALCHWQIAGHDYDVR